MLDASWWRSVGFPRRPSGYSQGEWRGPSPHGRGEKEKQKKQKTHNTPLSLLTRPVCVQIHARANPPPHTHTRTHAQTHTPHWLCGQGSEVRRQSRSKAPDRPGFRAVSHKPPHAAADDPHTQCIRKWSHGNTHTEAKTHTA